MLAVDLPPEAVEANRTILAACETALRPTRCTAAGVAGQARIRVRWPRDAVAHVEHWDGQRWHAQILTFNAEDEAQERWRAVGLLVAALASETSETDSSARSASARGPRPERRSSLALAVTTAALSGPGATRDHWRTGALVAVSGRPQRWPLGVRVALSGAFGSTRDAAIDASWWRAALGPYVVLEPLPPLKIALGVDVGWERLAVGMSGLDARNESRGYPTIRPWASAGFPLSSWFGLQAGVEFATTPGHAVRVDGRSVGENPAVGVLALAGLEFSVFE